MPNKFIPVDQVVPRIIQSAEKAVRKFMPPEATEEEIKEKAMLVAAGLCLSIGNSLGRFPTDGTKERK